MTENRKLPEAIQWHEGMLLSPQHFQQSDVRLDALLGRQRAHFLPFHWGVQQWALDETALADGIFRLMEMEAVLPDGLMVDFRDRSDERLEIDLSPHMETLKSKSCRIWLAVPGYRGDVSWTEGDLPRYRSVEGDPVQDLNKAGDEIRIPRLMPILSLHAKKPTNVYSFLPLAEVTNLENVLSLTDFCAPCLSVPKKSAIWRMCQELNATLRRKVNAMSAMLESQRGGDPAMVAKLETTLHFLVTGLPQFEVLLGSTPPHPFTLYQSLNLLAGHLAALSESKVPKVPPAYDHNDPLAAFKAVFDDLKDTLERRVSESWLAINFQRKADYYTVHFKEEWLQRDLVIGAVRGPLGEQDAKRWMMHAVIGLRCELDDLRKRRVEGLEREPVERVSGLAPPEGTSLFSVERVEGFLKPDEELIVLPVTREPDIRPANLILYIK